MKNIKVLLNKIAGATLKTKILAGAVAVAITVVPVTAVVAYNNHQEEVRLAQELEARELAEKVEKERKEKEEEEKKKAEEEAKLKAEEEAKAQEEEAQAQEQATQDSNNTVTNNKPNSGSSNTGNNNAGTVAPKPQPPAPTPEQPKPTKPSGWDAAVTANAKARIIQTSHVLAEQEAQFDAITDRMFMGQISATQAEAEMDAIARTVTFEKDGVTWWREVSNFRYRTERGGADMYDSLKGGYGNVKVYYNADTNDYTYHMVSCTFNSAWQ